MAPAGARDTAGQVHDPAETAAAAAAVPAAPTCSADVLNTLFNREDPAVLSNSYLALLISRYTYPTAFGISSTADHTQVTYRELYARKWTALGAAPGSLFFVDEDVPLALISLLTSQPEAHAVIFATKHDVWVSFRGLTNIEAGLGDSARFLPVNGTFGPEGQPRYLPVHGGFYSSFAAVWPRVQQAVDQAMQYTQDPSQARVYLTGHSMGAGLAAFTAMRLVDAQVPVGGLYLFGAPKMGQQSFIDAFIANGLDLITFSWWNELDMIPGMSPPLSRSALPYVQLPVESTYRIWQGKCLKADGPTAMQCPLTAVGERCRFNLNDHFAFTYVMKLQDCLLDQPQITSSSCLGQILKATM
ncbi:Alpha/Beta hydrolase protein [Scenedesmus sp. NREL 46B-D3]|nr:Alpha/Beta hydrolase protein [Scenedesmus sp. NREL 46B-D3]